MQSIQRDILGAIGKTPLIELHRFAKGHEGRLFAKLEYLSPGLSKKDRIALKMVEDAERSGQLKPGQPVIELTSGSMGTGLSIVCRQKGHPFIAVMSKGNSIERAQMMKAFGAEVILVDQHPDSKMGRVTGRDLERVEEKTRELTARLGAYRIDQFVNPASLSTGEDLLGPEILEQLGGTPLHAFVDFMGTGGNFLGIARALKKHDPNIRCYGLEPANAPFYGSGRRDQSDHIIQGGGYNISLPFVEEHGKMIDDFLTVTDDAATEAARALAHEEGIFAGYSSGANAAAALGLLKNKHRKENILFITPDSGTKYLSTPLWDLL